MAIVRLCRTLVAILVTFSLQTYTVSGIKRLSKDISDKRVTEGDSVTFNCTITDRENAQYRIYWYIDWTPGNIVDDGMKYVAELNEVIDVPDGHGMFTLEYNRIEGTAENSSESDAIHVCLLKITAVRINDNGLYACMYYHAVLGHDALISGPRSLFVNPGEETAAPKITTDASTTTLHFGGSSGNSGSAAAGAVSAVLFIIIVILVAVWAIFRYKRYRRDQIGKETQLPMELPKIEVDHNSYGDVTVNGAVSHEANTENPIINDEPSVRLPPLMESNNPPAYSTLNRPDSEIRNLLGESTYDLPANSENSDEHYAVPPDSDIPPVPPKTSSRQGGNNSEMNASVRTSTNSPPYEISIPGGNNLPPGDNSLRTPVRTSSTNSTAYELLANAENPSPSTRMPPRKTGDNSPRTPVRSSSTKSDGYEQMPNEGNDNADIPARSSSLQPGHITHAPVRTSSTNSTAYEILAEDSEPPTPARTSSRQARDNSPHVPVRTSSTYPKSSDNYPSVPVRTSSKNSGGTHYMDEDNLAYMADMGTVYEDVPGPDTKL